MGGDDPGPGAGCDPGPHRPLPLQLGGVQPQPGGGWAASRASCSEDHWMGGDPGDGGGTGGAVLGGHQLLGQAVGREWVTQNKAAETLDMGFM